MIKVNIIWLTIMSILSTALIIGGFLYIPVESSTANEVELFGNSFSSSNIGLVIIFVGISIAIYTSYIVLKVRQLDACLAPKGGAGGNANVIGNGEALGGKGGNSGSFGPGGKGGNANVIGSGKAKGGAGGDGK